MELELIELEEKMQDYVNKYISNISKISTGRANPEILSSIKIMYYDSPISIHEIASITIPEPRQLLIKPYDLKINKEIVGAINNSNISIPAVNEGDRVRMTFPILTEERRKELVKSLSTFTEQAKVGIRLVRQEANKIIKNNDISEDQEREEFKNIQVITDKYISKVDEVTKKKTEDLMTI